MKTNIKSVFTLFAVVMSACSIFSSCSWASVCVTDENGSYIVVEDYDSTKFVTRELDLADFTAIKATGYTVITFKQSPTFSVVARSTEDMFEKTKIAVEGSTLVIDMKGIKKIVTPVLLSISAPDLNDLDLGGNCKFCAGRVETSSAFDIDLSGAGRIEFGNLSCRSLNAETSGATHLEGKIKAEEDVKLDCNGAVKNNLDLSGRNLEAECSGASKLDINFTGEDAKFDCSGASKMVVGFTGNNLDLECSGASKIEATLNCKRADFDCSGASKIIARGTAGNTHFNTSGASSVDTRELNNY